MLNSTTIINALIVALANVLMVEDAEYARRIREVEEAAELFKAVFTSPTTGEPLKISAIKFVRANTDMGLVDAKTLVLDYIFVEKKQPKFQTNMIRRMQDRTGVTNR